MKIKRRYLMIIAIITIIIFSYGLTKDIVPLMLAGFFLALINTFLMLLYFVDQNYEDSK